MPDDVAEICRICAEGWRDTYSAELSEEEIEAVIAKFYVPERVTAGLAEDSPGWGGWWVAERDGEVIGAGGGGLTEPGVGELFVLYADIRRRREGAGSALLEAITAQQAEYGAREQWVSVSVRNANGIGFYELHGFVPRGTVPAHETSGEIARYFRRLP